MKIAGWKYQRQSTKLHASDFTSAKLVVYYLTTWSFVFISDALTN